MDNTIIRKNTSAVNLTALKKICNDLTKSSKDAAPMIFDHISSVYSINDILDATISLQNDDKYAPTLLGILAHLLVEYEWKYQSDVISKASFKSLDKTFALFVSKVTNKMALTLLMHLIQDSRLPWSDKVKDTTFNALAHHQDNDNDTERQELNDRPPEEIAQQMIEELGEINALKTFISHLERMDIEAQLHMISELLANNIAMITEMFALMLVHTEKKVAYQIATSICYCIDERGLTITPKALSRIMLAKNLLKRGSKQYKHIEALFMYCRKAGFNEYYASNPTIKSIFATTPDGSGSSGITIIYSKNKKHHMAGFVLKLAVGLKDAYVSEEMAASKAKAYIQELVESPSINLQEVDKSHLQTILEIGLWLSHKNNQHIDFDTFAILEALDIYTIAPKKLDIESDSLLLKEAISPYINLDDKFIKQSYARSDEFYDRFEHLTSSWFDYNQEMIEIVQQTSNDQETYKRFKKYFLRERCDYWASILYLSALLYTHTNKAKHRQLTGDLLLIVDALIDPKLKKKHPFILDLIEESYHATIHQA